MHFQFLIFLSVVTTVLSLGAFYLGVSWLEHLRAYAWVASRHQSVAHALVLGLALFVAIQLLGPILYRRFPNRLGRLFIVHWVSYTSLGIFASVFLYTVSVDLLLAIARRGVAPDLFRSLEHFGFEFVVLATASTAMIGMVQALLGPKVRHVDVPIEDLPEALEGFRIVQVSDLHVGPTIGRRYVERVVEMVNALQADAIALTGDFVDGEVKGLEKAVAPLREMRSKYGNFYVTGNHEYYWNASDWIACFEKLGWVPLLNKHVVLEHRGARVVMAGVPDSTGAGFEASHAPDLERALAGAPSNTVVILLAHQPTVERTAAKLGVRLQLSGHTHGGQFYPWSLIVRLFYRFHRGLYKVDGLSIYVNRGTGYWGPPIRFGVRAEIALLRLVRQIRPV